MVNKSKILVVGVACAVALTACGSDAPTSEEKKPVLAKDDYTLETAQKVLESTKIGDGEIAQVMRANKALALEDEEDLKKRNERSQKDLESVTSDPAECLSSATIALSGGTMSGEGYTSELMDTVVGAGPSTSMISVRVVDSRAASDQFVENLKKDLDQCKEFKVEDHGAKGNSTISTEDKEVEGAGKAFSFYMENDLTGEEKRNYHGNIMSSGNSVVFVAIREDGGAKSEDSDPKKQVDEVQKELAQAFVKGPTGPTESGSPQPSSDES